MTQTVPPGNPEAPTTPEATTPERGADGGHAAVRALPAALRRRVPKYADLAPLMQFRKPGFGRAARLRRASTIWDLRDMAKRRTPQAPFDYTDGAAEAEITLRRARQAFLDIEFRPGILRNVSSVDLSTDILGRPSRLPVGIAPDGIHPDDAVRGRIRRLPGCRSRRHPLHALHHGHRLHRGRGRRRTGRPELVPALPVDGPGPLAGADPARRRRRATTPSWSPWTRPSPGPGSATSATA